jgi:hypothetical protein
VLFQGNTNDTIHKYLNEGFEGQNLNFENRKGNGTIKIKNIDFYAQNRNEIIQTGRPMHIDVFLDKISGLNIETITLDFRIDDYTGNKLYWGSTDLLNSKVKSFKNGISIKIPKLYLNEGKYYLTLFLVVNNAIADFVPNIAQFEVISSDFYGTGRKVPESQSKLYLDFEIHTH